MGAVRIPLSRGLTCVIDADDLPLVAGYSWHAHRGAPDAPFYAARTEKGGDGKRRLVYLHRVLAGAGSAIHVDHINGDTLDNRRPNLRRVTRSENMQNRRGAARNSKTGVRGVHWEPDRQRYVAQVQRGGRPIFRARFFTLGEATAAVIEARRSLMTHSAECR